MSKQGFTTRQIHADRQLNQPEHGAVHTASTNSVLFEFKDAQGIIDVFQGKQAGHVYGRSSTGSAVALANQINALEGGCGAVCFATGMAAISGLFLALFRQGDHIIVSQYLFGNTRSLMATLSDIGLQISFVDVTSLEAIQEAYQPNTRAVFTETVANPATQVADIQAIGKYCQERQIPLIVDNTMSPPPLFNARDLGASLVVSSLTKFVAGHGNALGGVVVDTGLYDWQAFDNIKPAYQVADPRQWGLTQIKKKGLRDMGATLSPDAAHKIAVGMETLGLRMQRACNNAQQLATFLDNHDKVARVFYPGLADHPQHFIAREQMQNGYGAMLSIDLIDSIDPVAFLNALTLVICATHLGDTRTLALPVAPTIFFESGAQERARMGISETMIRISVGIEDLDDLIADFGQALNQF
ncbi:cystathionine gamma-synthase family protein [Salinimonas sediminis]|uniref:Cystathionine gamma-synthase family protein n=1 Tax=Salinimonas sediminis TaxID=2303538 RepID=A0A346NLI4_9ALTE|nr:cystathionine gamma-synthase family protein [Salinimonas sediminis]AXR06391.1 cystathionine gamma-synthase family protein [Salinimonas sediminis]